MALAWKCVSFECIFINQGANLVMGLYFILYPLRLIPSIYYSLLSNIRLFGINPYKEH